MPWIAPVVGAVAGGLFSSGGSGATSTQKADPWSGAQPGLLALYQGALQNYNNGGPQYYQGNTVAGQSDVTQQAQRNIYSLATGGSPTLNNANQQAQNTLNGSYLNAAPGSQGLYNMGTTDFLSNNAAAQDLYDSTGRDFFQTNPGMNTLNQIGEGGMLNSNPYVDSMFGQASQAVGNQFSKNVMPGIASMFSGAGRYGSNQMAEGLGQAQQQYGSTLDNLATQIYGGNYANERTNQQQALNQLGQFGLQATGQRQNALQSLTQMGLSGQGLQQQALGGVNSAYANERGNQMTAMNAAPGLNTADYYGAGQLANLGASQDAYNQSLINADMARYNFGQNAPNNQLSFLSGIMNGAPMGQTTSTSINGSPFTGAVAGARMANSIFNSQTSTQPYSNPNSRSQTMNPQLDMGFGDPSNYG